MNIEIANRLAELRKKSGLSQEELADKLGLSRQAISKWERAESSPDTDNLILLAKLYNVSLDDLLKTEKTVDEIIKDNKENINENEKDSCFDNEKNGNKKREEGRNQVYIGPGGIHVTSEDGDEVHVGLSGIRVGEGEQKYESKNYYCSNKNLRRRRIVSMLYGLFMVLACVAYILLGLFWKGYCYASDSNNAGWAAGWIVFLVAPIIPSIIDGILSKKPSKTNFIFMGLSAYLYMGMMTMHGWHPWWCLVVVAVALTIIAGLIDDLMFSGKTIIKTENDEKIVNEKDADTDKIENED